jgi:hypothetical protein
MATWDRYRNRNPAGLEVRLRSGAVAGAVVGYCDDPDLGPVGVYLTKGPVCKLTLAPAVQFPNVNIAWDISLSRSATSTIDTFDISWGGTTDIGDLSGQDWSSDPKSGNVQYTGAGIYTVTATVTDLLGQASKPAKLAVQIVTKEQRVYIGTSDSGLFIMTPDADPAASNSGLSGAPQLEFRVCRLHPAYRDLPLSRQHLWAATADGVSYSTDGGATWSNISKATLGAPENAAGDSPAPATADLDQIDLWFDPLDVRRIYLQRTTATRAWEYRSDDYGATWSNEQVGVS